MSSKVSITKIVKDHFSTLVDQNSNKPGGDDIFYFILLPVVLPIIAVWLLEFDFFESEELKKTLISSLAIFVGLLFNALVILINIAKNGETKNIKQKVIQQLIANISFSIVTAFIAVVIILIRFWIIPGFIEVSFLPTINQLIDFCALFLLTNFFFTFLMIMKRTYLMF